MKSLVPLTLGGFTALAFASHEGDEECEKATFILNQPAVYSCEGTVTETVIRSYLDPHCIVCVR